MDTSFIAFWEQVTTNPMLMVSVILTLAVIFVNGWTDAPKRHCHLCHHPLHGGEARNPHGSRL